MAKKTTKKIAQPGSLEAVKPGGYPVDDQTLQLQQQRLKKAAAAGVAATSATTTASPISPVPTQVQPLLVATVTKAVPAVLPASVARPAVTQPGTAAPSRKVGEPTHRPKPVSTNSVEVSFKLVRPGAKQVCLCGDFNGWSPSSTPMKRHEDGHWDASLGLAPGCYEYKFLADGEWLLDPAAQKNVPNRYGSLNSVVEVRT